MSKERKTIIIIIIIFILLSYTLKLTTSIRYNLGNDSISLEIEDKTYNDYEELKNKENKELVKIENISENDLNILEKINNMNQSELMKIDGIGEVIAKRIINYRKVNGNFERVDEIIKIKGIGQKKLENIMKDVQKSDIISN